MLPVTIENPLVAACEELQLLISPTSKLEVRPIANLEELRRLHTIDADAYQECSITFDCFANWWQRYPDGNTVVFSGDEIVASIGLWAIYEEQFRALSGGEICEMDIAPITLAECEQEPQRYWYASGIVLKKELRGKVKSNPIKLMIDAAISNWTESNRVAYPLKVLALGEYQQGINMLLNFGFQKIRDGVDLPDKCDLYCLEANEEEIERILKSRNL